MQFCNFPQYVYKVTKTTDFFVTSYFPSAGFVQDPQTAARRANIVILSLSDEQPSITLIDVTMAAHNALHADPDYHPGSSAIHRAAEKHASYDAEFITADPDVKWMRVSFYSITRLR